MSKLMFRARQLDATKHMQVYKAEEIPEMPDFAAINRGVPQMPTGMEKEEETVRFVAAILFYLSYFLLILKIHLTSHLCMSA